MRTVSKIKKYNYMLFLWRLDKVMEFVQLMLINYSLIHEDAIH